ncbi:guanine deaminase [Phycisphaerales bacterium]|nr:guanine deaminase [Phycisphaerales bacterium]
MSTSESPTPSSAIVLEGQLLLPVTGRGLEVALGRVVMRGGVIEAVHVGESGPRADLGSPEHFICPGFVDAHVHLPQFDSIGVDGMELLEWLHQAIFPAEAKWEDERYASEMSGRVARQLLSFGTTAVAAYATVHPASAQAAIDVLAEHGIAGHVGQVLMDREAPAELLLPAREALSAAGRMRGRGRIQPAVTPRFAVTCSREMLEGAGRLARETGWVVQTHLSETRAECALVKRLHGGENYAEVYERAGLLGHRTLLGHGIHLADEELGLLAMRGAWIAHCPTANRFLRAGTFDRARAMSAGVKIALGSDVAGGPDRSMVRVARGMIEAAKERGTRPPTSAEAWWQITGGNAWALGLVDTGRLEAGCAGDVVVARPDSRWREAADPLGALMYAWDDRWVEGVWCGGTRRYG